MYWSIFLHIVIALKEGKILIKLLSEVTSGKWEREGRLNYFIKNCSCVPTVFVFLLVSESLEFHIFLKIKVF